MKIANGQKFLFFGLITNPKRDIEFSFGKWENLLHNLKKSASMCRDFLEKFKELNFRFIGVRQEYIQALGTIQNVSIVIWKKFEFLMKIL